MLDVVAAIIKNNDRVLIARKKQGKSLEGYWEFPGGKIEVGETPEESLIREIKEELMVEIKIVSYFGENIHDYGKTKVRLMAFIAEIVSGEIVLKDHDAIEWVTVGELDNYFFAPADLPFVNKLKLHIY